MGGHSMHFENIFSNLGHMRDSKTRTKSNACLLYAVRCYLWLENRVRTWQQIRNVQGTKYSELMFEWLESRLKLWVFRKCTKQSWAILSWDLYWLNIWRFTCHLLLIQRFKSLVPPKPWVRSTQLGWVGLDFWVTETSPL